MFPPWLIVVGVVALIALIVVAAFVAERKRTGALQRTAGELGMQFIGGGGGVPAGAPGRCRLFSHGRGWRHRNLMRGTIADLEALLFDYSYTTGGGRSQTTHRQTVAAFRLADATLPEFELRPENVFHKIGSAFGYEDIDFQQHPSFSSRYLLRGAEEEAIRRAFNEEVVAYLEQSRGLCVEVVANWLIAYRSGRRVKPNLLGGFLEEAFTVCNKLG